MQGQSVNRTAVAGQGSFLCTVSSRPGPVSLGRGRPFAKPALIVGAIRRFIGANSPDTAPRARPSSNSPSAEIEIAPTGHLIRLPSFQNGGLEVVGTTAGPILPRFDQRPGTVR